MDQTQYIIDRLEALDNKFDEKLDKIIVQTTKTNGRVSNLEEWRKHIQKIIWGCVGIIITMLGFLLEKYINTPR